MCLSALDRICYSASYRICKELFKCFLLAIMKQAGVHLREEMEHLRFVGLECFRSQMSGFLSRTGCINDEEQHFKRTIGLFPWTGGLGG